MKKAVIADDKISVALSTHPWIFSGAVIHLDPVSPGELVQLVDPKGKFLALGYAHPDQSLMIRILSYQDEPIEQLLLKRLQQAYVLRKHSGLLDNTNAYRLINAEGDRLGGLIVDVYDRVCVIQISTCGMERLRQILIKLLVSEYGFSCILEKSDSSSRALEGLQPVSGVIYGSLPKECLIVEHGVVLKVDLEGGQKTGFFLDQRPMRVLLAQHAKNKRVLNMFCYTGGFSLHVLKHQAASCTSVDVDKEALKLLDELIAVNKIDPSTHHSVVCDAFEFLDKTDLSEFDMIILDPPAFAKKRGDVEAASRGYKNLMIKAFLGLKEGAYVYVASCSYFIDEALFEKLLLQAAKQTGSILKLLSKQHEAIDHPRLASHKEGSYLKGFFVQVFKS